MLCSPALALLVLIQTTMGATTYGGTSGAETGYGPSTVGHPHGTAAAGTGLAGEGLPGQVVGEHPIATGVAEVRIESLGTFQEPAVPTLRLHACIQGNVCAGSVADCVTMCSKLCAPNAASFERPQVACMHACTAAAAQLGCCARTQCSMACPPHGQH
jgi:hypothetical protein